MFYVGWVLYFIFTLCTIPVYLTGSYYSLNVGFLQNTASTKKICQFVVHHNILKSLSFMCLHVCCALQAQLMQNYDRKFGNITRLLNNADIFNIQLAALQNYSLLPLTVLNYLKFYFFIVGV